LEVDAAYHEKGSIISELKDTDSKCPDTRRASTRFLQECREIRYEEKKEERRQTRSFSCSPVGKANLGPEGGLREKEFVRVGLVHGGNDPHNLGGDA
jgi:hypothetical protein